MRQKLLMIGKTLINSGILLMLLLSLPVMSDIVEYNTHIVWSALAITFIGCFLCIAITNIKPQKKYNPNQFRHPLIMLYFKTIKWLLIVAVIFNIIAACIILFFYCLKHEFEATLLITVLAGIVIGLVCEVAIPYYRNYNDKNKNKLI